ncbi:MAG: HD domain-containing protein [Spirochaetaceae bacterium]|jgi:HD-GYP domain-containing protein (c-di-GMP phosphodiesterase class II)|nr:HD domain-containing protein [Spirochaetaceae bacterium]
MAKIAAAALKEGQKFTKPVFIDDDNIFIPENTAIRAKDLGLLASLGIDEVFTDGTLVPGSPESASAGQDGPAFAAEPKTRQSDAEVLTVVTRLVRQLGAIFNAIAGKKQVNLRLLWVVTDGLLQLVKADSDSLLNLIVSESVTGQEIAKKGVYTAAVAAVIGEKLDFPAKENQELAAAALLHDAGMLRLPDSIAKKSGPLSAREVDTVMTHPLLSFNILKKELLYPDSVCMIALEHHEHWDGTGYPRRISGGDIEQGALILSVADAFTAMMCRCAYRSPMTGYQAMKTLMAGAGSFFSPDVLQTFVRIIGVYPIGSGVLLNDGSVARVAAINASAPLRPVLRIAAADSGAAGEETVDLLTNHSLFITGAVDLASLGEQP